MLYHIEPSYFMCQSINCLCSFDINTEDESLNLLYTERLGSI